MGDKGLKAAISASRDWNADTSASAPMVDGSPGISAGRARGSGIISAIAPTVVTSRKAITPKTFTKMSQIGEGAKADQVMIRRKTGRLRRLRLIA
jgi:hypothetical protein